MFVDLYDDFWIDCCLDFINYFLSTRYFFALNLFLILWCILVCFLLLLEWLLDLFDLLFLFGDFPSRIVLKGVMPLLLANHLAVTGGGLLDLSDLPRAGTLPRCWFYLIDHLLHHSYSSWVLEVAIIAFFAPGSRHHIHADLVALVRLLFGVLLRHLLYINFKFLPP